MNNSFVWIVAVFLAGGMIEYFEEADREAAHQRALREFSSHHNATGVSVRLAERIVLH